MRNMRYQGTLSYDRNRQYSQSNTRQERGSLSSGRGRQDIQDGAVVVFVLKASSVMYCLLDFVHE